MEGCQVEELLFLELVWTYCHCEKIFLRYKLVLRDLLSVYLLCDSRHHYVFKNIPESPLSPRIKPSTGLHWSIYWSDWQWHAGLCVHARVGVRWYVVFCWCQSKCVRVREREWEGGGRLFHLYEWIIKALITSMAEDVVKLKCLQVSDTFLWLCLVW